MKGILKQLKKHAPAVLILGVVVGFLLYQQFPVWEGLTIQGVVMRDGDIVTCSDVPITAAPINLPGAGSLPSITIAYRAAVVDGGKLRKLPATMRNISSKATTQCNAPLVAGADVATESAYTTLKAAIAARTATVPTAAPNAPPPTAPNAPLPTSPNIPPPTTLSEVETAKKSWSTWLESAKATWATWLSERQAAAVAAKAAAEKDAADVKAAAAEFKKKAETDANAVKKAAETAKATAANEVAAAKLLTEQTKAKIDKDTAALKNKVTEFEDTTKKANDTLNAEKKKLADQQDAFQTGLIAAAGVLGVILIGGLVYSMAGSSSTPTTGAGRRRR
jgi:hypothetical protein